MSVAPADWSDLARELDAWGAAGRIAAFWWRDDDATAPSAALDRLLSVAGEVPLALAVIPARAEPALADRLRGWPVAVLKNGAAHRNHAPPDARKCELVAERPAGEVDGELVAGRERLAALFPAAFLPVLVPPWNRIAAAVTARLPGLGFRGLSTLAPRGSAVPVPGLVQANVHADIVDWRGGRRFRGEAAVLGAIVAHLAARRAGRADPGEATGLLTHHLVHDAASLRFLERLTATLAEHPAARWIAPAALFAAPEASPA